MKVNCWLLVPWLLIGCSGDAGGGDAAGDDDDTLVGDDDDVVGDDDDDGVPIVECTDDFVACGGDPTGSWQVDALCDVYVDTSALGCGGVTYEITDDRSSGTVDLEAGGVYSRTYQLDFDYLVHVPDSCLVGPISCDNLAALSQGAFTECTDTGTGTCDCTGALSEVDSYTGTWTVEGNEIVTDDADRAQFCATGTRAQTLHEDGTRVHWAR